MKIRNLIFLFLFICIGYLANEKLSNKEEKTQSILKDQKKAEKKFEADINRATLRDFLSKHVSLKKAEKIIKFRNTVGVIQNIEELQRMSGFGKATIKNIKKDFIVDNKKMKKKKRIDINTASDEVLLWYGFTKSEIKKIDNYKLKNGKIYSNLDFEKIINDKRYIEFKDIVIYSQY